MSHKKPADKETKFKKDYILKEYRELGDERGDAVTHVECEDRDGNVLVKLTMKDGDCINQSATEDAQESGLYEDVAKKYGIKKEDLKYTKASLMAARGGNQSEKDTKEQGDGHDPLGEGMTMLKKAEEHPMDQGKPDGAKRHLTSIAHHLSELKSMGFGGEDVPDWVESKMAQAADDIAEVAHFFDSEQEGDLDKSKDRCWDGYEPTPGKKPYSKGSCRKTAKLKKCGELMMKCKTKADEAQMLEKGDVVKVNFGEKKVEGAEGETPAPKKDESSYDFDAVQAKNKENKQRMKDDRAKANRSVTRSYRLKKGEDKPFHGYNKEKHSKEGGLNDKARKKYNREEGANLKRPVTQKNPKGEAKGRKKSFCARMSGVKGPTSKDGKLTPKGAALKRWNCSKSLDVMKKCGPLKKSDGPRSVEDIARAYGHHQNKWDEAYDKSSPRAQDSGEHSMEEIAVNKRYADFHEKKLGELDQELQDTHGIDTRHPEFLKAYSRVNEFKERPRPKLSKGDLIQGNFGKKPTKTKPKTSSISTPKPDEDFEDRKERIRQSLSKINALMEQVRNKGKSSE